MKKDYTKIVFVVDRSGSMEKLASDIIGGYNKFIADQKALKVGTCDVSYYQFDNEYEAVYENTPVEFVKDLDKKTFVPRGGTALYDAVGRTIENVGKHLAKLNENERPDKVLFVILTDGLENASHTYTSERVKQMVEHQQNVYKWEFVYIGANQNAWDTGTNIGIKYSNNLTYASNSAGATSAFYALSDNTSSMRTAVKSNFSFELKDIEDQIKAGAKIDLNAVKTNLAADAAKTANLVP